MSCKKLLATVLIFLFLAVPANAATYTYDSLGRLKTVTYDNGQQIIYSYDAGGNRLSKTVTEPDTTAPVIVNTAPSNNAVNVPLNKNISVTFSENVYEGTQYNNIIVRNTVDNTLAVYTAAINGNVLTIDPASLNTNVIYEVIIPAGAIKDIGSNLLAGDYRFTFTTESKVETTLQLEGTSTGTGWYTTDVKVNLTITNSGAGVAQTVYCVRWDNYPEYCTWVEYTGPFMMGPEGTQYLFYKSVSDTGNEEDVKYSQIKIDKTKPSVKIKSPTDGSAVVSGQNVMIAATASDANGISKVEFYCDGVLLGEGKFQPGNYPRLPYYFIYWLAEPGQHTITARAYDKSLGEYTENSITLTGIQ